MGKYSTVKHDMANQTTEKTISDKVSTVKVSALWYFVEWYLEFLQSTGAKYDEEFSRYFKQLYDYVCSKIAVPQAKNILDEYVVYEVEI